MRTLFIDTHSGDLSFIFYDGVTDYKEEVSCARDMSVVIIPTLEKLLSNNGIELSSIQEIIVVNGPGSFTGVRMGVTIAKCLAYSLNVPIKTITALEAYGVSSSKKFDVVVVPDPKGVYSARKVTDEYVDFMYQKTSVFQDYIKKNSYDVLETKILDIKKICEYVSNRESINPHLVNPIYIKEIDALK